VRSRVLVALRIAAPAQRVFDSFTVEIGSWWRPHPMFEFSEGRSGRMVFEPGLGGRLTETYDNGDVFEIGRIREWDPPKRLVFGWRQANFDADQETEVHVSFEPVGPETRVTVEHFGWDGIPQGHAARHGFPLLPFQQRSADWWRALLEALRAQATEN
jgi:uncharacterized protein YndB with AHSA1/START domain